METRDMISREESGLEIGIGRRARRAYGFDEIALVPGGVTLNPDEVDISFSLANLRPARAQAVETFAVALPFWGSSMDCVVDVEFAIAMGKLGGAAVLNFDCAHTPH